ncbi:unnamed protein product [Anisakis simplex]|uniref:S1 motif domain-containing protein n=1 Tax=Anisakis simplex TaxID=6269 RepID=A0A0M3KAX0_ANISI|nr:unnamed protein product [Anisakis simplex]
MYPEYPGEPKSLKGARAKIEDEIRYYLAPSTFFATPLTVSISVSLVTNGTLQFFLEANSRASSSIDLCSKKGDTVEAVIKSKDVQMEKPEVAKSTRSSGRESQSPPNRLSLKSENQADASNSQRPEQTPQGLSKAFF